MADNKKETERAELHRTIWGIANDLRGSVDGWDFKQYVLGMLFYRYISENLDHYISKGEWEAGNKDFRYSKLSDKEAETAKDDIVKEKGFFILPSWLFCNVLEKANKDNTDLNEKLEKIFKEIEGSALGTDSEDDFKGLFDDIDVNSNKLGATVTTPLTNVTVGSSPSPEPVYSKLIGVMSDVPDSNALNRSVPILPPLNPVPFSTLIIALTIPLPQSLKRTKLDWEFTPSSWRTDEL